MCSEVGHVKPAQVRASGACLSPSSQTYFWATSACLLQNRDVANQRCQGHLRYKDELSEDRIQPFLLPCQAEELCRGCAVPSCMPSGQSVGPRVAQQGSQEPSPQAL